MVRTLKIAPWAKDPNFGQQIPVMHNVKVSYSGLTDDEQSERWREQRDWCEKFCRDKWYPAPAWTPAWGFEDDEDATAFALRWA